METEIKQLVENWIKIDPDVKSKAKVQELVDKKEFAKLKQILNPNNRLEFGTAGLRGEVAPGYCCMNQVVIMQTAQGILNYVKKNFPENKSICIAHDARHYSDVFSDITAGVFIAAGYKVYYFRQLSPTPYAAFFTEYFKCVCGVMVTASHNPSQDNGYKVYGMNRGVQIVPPHDSGIQKMIEESTSIQETTYKYADYLTEEYKQKGLFVELNEQSPETQIYYDNIKKLCRTEKTNGKLHFVPEYSAMWGVGTTPAKRAMKTFGFDLEQIRFYEDSCIPDPNFGGEKRPNPEERHNMVKLCEKAGKDVNVIVVNDPDADRFALAEKVNGEWIIYHGNEIGALLCEWNLQNTTGNDRQILCSTVSSQILKKMAQKYGVFFEETLTGFKWLATVARSFPERNTVFAFEEAIGYTSGNNGLIVGDKDGISTVCVALELANYIYAQGKTIKDYLHNIYVNYGFHAWQNSGITVGSMKEVADLFIPLFGSGEKREYCMQIGRFKVNRVRDMKKPGFDSEFGVPKLPVSGSEMISFYCDEIYCTFRPSGTEPKVKYYIEAISKKSNEDAQNIAKEFEQAFKKLLGK